MFVQGSAKAESSGRAAYFTLALNARCCIAGVERGKCRKVDCLSSVSKILIDNYFLLLLQTCKIEPCVNIRSTVSKINYPDDWQAPVGLECIRTLPGVNKVPQRVQTGPSLSRRIHVRM